MSNQRACCSVVEETRMQVRERRAQKPQSWIVLKLAVFLTIAINGYAAYVYVGIFCKDMIVRSSSALGSQTMGIVFLTVFCILFLVVSWSYIMIITTPPGHATRFVEKTEKPGQQLMHQLSSTPGDTPGISYELLSAQVVPSRTSSHDSDTRMTRDDPNDRLQPLSTVENTYTVTSTAAPTAAPQDTAFQPPQHQTVDIPEEAHAPDTDIRFPRMTSPDVPLSHVAPHQNNSNSPRVRFPRQPQMRLLPEQRYCNKDKIIKPPRAHHCRACGTCILKYDHHCPWVGHCVGAFNQKFFVNFVQWASILAFWIFGSLLGLILRSQRRSTAPDLNPQEIVVTALSGFFGMFCAMMFMTQVQLIMLNQTTIESMSFRTLKNREQADLAKNYGLCDISAKRRMKRNRDNEWGRIGKEGNIWWLGSRENWESVMGKNVWWWFLPVGYGLQDGLSYPTNPRFDKQGILRKRREWPSDL